MDQDYDRKFEEMKKYIPFLESMIKRLENNNSKSNPRQAQLDKIRSLRDLLLDKKKRMKMENLLKCEQVLVNLYSKVEQKEALPSMKSASDPTLTSKDSGEELEVVRTNLKSVTTKIEDEQDTLPEIARASATEELCTPGSKEPALFQRRPNKSSISQTPSKSPNKSSKRNYTRVLVSPEPGTRRWANDGENTSSSLPFRRRSPRRSPKRHSPTYHKKEKKKTKQGQLSKAKDLNITLNVPEDSLDSLNTKDILTRIMNCSDGDVDIETLREAKRQILNELKNTGAKCDDISDLLLKSYEKKDIKKIDEVEEGELSDSESEAIQSIYGNFILEGDKDETSESKDADNIEKPRKIQICLVINPDNENRTSDIKDTPIKPHDTLMADFEMYDDKSMSSTNDTEKGIEIEKVFIETDNKNTQVLTKMEKNVDVQLETASEKVKEASTVEVGKPANFYKLLNDQGNSNNIENSSEHNKIEQKVDSCESKPDHEIQSTSSTSLDERPEVGTYSESSKKGKEGVEIPLLNEPSIASQKPKEDVVSEIDILQALKNEILSESLSLPGSETTPLLHQPKITKVSSVQEIVPKKRISIEKYMKKSEDSVKNSLFFNDLSRCVKEDNLKKQSLKLTEKECERFNFPVKLAFEDESEDDETDNGATLDDLYGNLVPKSPDNNESHRKKIPPIIIPAEPVKASTESSKADVDMRMIVSILSPNINTPVSSTDDLKQDVINTDKTRTSMDPRVRRDLNQPVNIDSSNMINSDRLTRAAPIPINFPNLNPMTPSMTPNRTSSLTTNLPSGIPQHISTNINPANTPTMTPHMTPSRNPNMTPNARSFEVVGRPNYEMDDNSIRKHVYAPIFPLSDQREGREQSVVREKEHRPYWDKPDSDVDKKQNQKWENIDSSERDPRSNSKEYPQSYNKYEKHNSRYKIDRRNSFNRSECPNIPFSRSECPNTSSHPFGRIDTSTRINPFSWSDCPTTPSNQFGRLDCPQTPNHPFGRSDCPQTPSHSFGRTDCPSTPIHSFGRSDCPTTPIHPFGRSDCPTTPIHPFGRSDCPTTPIHPFGRSDCPTTPIHPFGRSDCPTTPMHPFGRGDMPMTPSHPFGRSEHQSRDPRLNRSAEFESFYNDDRERHYYRERGMSNYNQYNKPDTHRKYREQSVGRNERNNYSSHDHGNPNHTSRNVRNSIPSDNLGIESNNGDSGVRQRKNFYRERSVGRSTVRNDRMLHSSSRTSSVSRINDDAENRLSVKPHTGKSFIIDTSINSTFQDFIAGSKDKRTSNSKFDHRKRAASVGRVLCRESSEGKSSHCDFSANRSFRRESSVGRSLHYDSKNKTSGAEIKNRSYFRRAQSMGRDIISSNNEKSLKDIKVDFENYKANYDLRNSKKLEKMSKCENIKKDRNSFKELKNVKSRNKEDMYENYGKKNYQSVKKSSDSKTCTEYDNYSKSNKDASSERNEKNVGIVYSNDNITKGKILGSGYGVKNYKIPKIKRPVEENIMQENNKEELKIDQEKADEIFIKNKTLKSKNNSSAKAESDRHVFKSKSKNVDKIYNSGDNFEKCSESEKPVTRSSRKCDTEIANNNKNIITKLRKSKKPLVYNSDSDTEPNEVKEKKTESSTTIKSVANEKQQKKNIVNTCNEPHNTLKTKEIFDESSAKTSFLKKYKDEKESKEPTVSTNCELQSSLKSEKTKSSIEETASNIKDQLENSFGMDDIDIFSDNIASDSVIDNINALIANLDSDLEPSKITTPTEFTNDINLDTMLENIESDENVNEKSLCEELTGIPEVIKYDINQPTNLKNEKESKNIANNSSLQRKENESMADNGACKLVNDVKTNDIINSTDSLVTTTGIDKDKVPKETKVENSEENRESSAAPDSTNEIIHEESGQEVGLPDSTDETQNDTNSIVTSSHDSTETISKDDNSNLCANNEPTSIKSIGTILSLLQNKSKLKELLNMLGDNSNENEKIKKKLEKLSEIVSDEDDVDNNQLDSTKDRQENSPHCSKDSINTNVDQNDIENVSDDNIKETVINKSIDETGLLESKDENAQIKEIDKLNNIKKVPVRKGKVTKRGRGRFSRKVAPKGLKRITRSEAKEIKPKKPSRELLQLQEDIKDMFISDEVLNATGIRMCRLAKLVDDKTSKPKEDMCNQESTEPVVILQKCKDTEVTDESRSAEKNINIKKKPGPKAKFKALELDDDQNMTNKLKTSKYKPGPKSKTKTVKKSDDEDPYAFESDSISEYNTKSIDNKEIESSESENESIGSSKSFESSELLIPTKKKPKRKRPGWQAGIIKPKNRKKKSELKYTGIRLNDDIALHQKTVDTQDLKCFTDKSYCFHENVFTYACCFCAYSGEDIVNHYKQYHPHSEIPLSRPSPEMAKQAIEQCEEINFQAISKIPTDTYVCRFCLKEFGRKKKSALEAFFWHVVSMHTGEYKHPCTICDSGPKCPFNLDIPPPPKDVKGQLIGYICEKCNFTQISLENLKTHVIVRHNDEKTEVYIINLGVMSLKSINALSKRCNAESEKRVLRSRRLSMSTTEASDEDSDVTDSDISNDQQSLLKTPKQIVSPSLETDKKIKYQSKITFETDDNTSETSSTAESLTIKKEKEDDVENSNQTRDTKIEVAPHTSIEDSISEIKKSVEKEVPSDIFIYPHFKIKNTEGGSKEYICCINGHENHYKTTLLISFKKHVQLKHSETWDGYCFTCKVIVTSQGKHKFQDCLHHYLDKHIDNFPIFETVPEIIDNQSKKPDPEHPPRSKPYINVRPLSELLSNETSVEEELPTLPKIERVVSLGESMVEPTQSSPIYLPVTSEPVVELLKDYRYEEVQAAVMSKKHRVVLETMMNHNKLVNVYKCAGRYCSFSSDSAEDALLHASTHQRVGGESSLICSYCDFECSGNAIDLVMHVFKAHSECPYSCGYCFYRAASSQVVAAHISRIHSGKPILVLSGHNITPPAFKGSSMLSREAVVQYYVCPHACKFRTYTAGKYCEHLQQRHSTESCHPCYICSASFESPVELIQHMKSHDLNVYQCTWCTHGACTEGNLLYHTSQRHPERQPQAYLRVITNKDGSSEFRVLPLASFNKTKVNVVRVAPGGKVKENPVREAERSIELEKLIGHTNQMIESMSPPPTVETTIESVVDGDVSAAGITVTDLDEVPGPSLPLPPVTPTPVAVLDTSQQHTPVLKREAPETSPDKRTLDDVVCLDSDDDEPVGPTNTHAPLEPAPPPSSPGDKDTLAASGPPLASAPVVQAGPRRVSLALLLKCASCGNQYRAQHAFRRHVNMCCPAGDMRCVHCGHVAADADQLLQHCLSEHSMEKEPSLSPYVCTECSLRFDTLAVAKRHVRYSHRVSRVTVGTECVDDGQRIVRVGPSGARRKRASADEPPQPKMVRYGPHDGHRLPIAPILEEAVFCAVCEFKTKVRLNMVRHLQLHAECQPAPSTAPVNPVPHLETNEMHFDRMLNLASSSIATRPERPPAAPSAALGAEAAARYPRLVPARQRLACGARGCSYISLDEAMLRRHWDALHAGSNDFRCVHCPPYQHLDTSKPLTAARIVAHLKMHDVALYACSACQFYHYRRPVVDKHAADAHPPPAAARSLVVREDVAAAPDAAAATAATPAPAPAPAPAAAPTMDLKPWRCGLCAFLSMLRPEVVDHCARLHQSKMQFKCMYCPFRTSARENVTKHQANAHPGKKADVFYYYYREGSVPDEPDGTPRWKRQREKFGCPDAPASAVKSETMEPEPEVSGPPPPPLDLNIVKQEVPETPLELPQLCAAYGQLCEPNGLKYKCPLCKVVIEDTKEAMQSHLYEELKYRKWACAICSYKAFHKTGLNEHIMSEHRGQNQQPTLLPVDANIEKWVSSVLEHQSDAIIRNKENFAKQKLLTEKPSTSMASDRSLLKPVQEKPADKFSMTELEQAFGELGVPNNMFFCCPKCGNYKVKEEASMRDHLENELSKIRWCCSKCIDKFQTYHEAQFHCKSSHAGLAARPVEAPRDSALRAAWVAAVLQVQRLSMRCLPITDVSETPEKNTPVHQDTPENSLLVIRHEETISTSEESIRRKRPAPEPDSDNERLVIDEQPPAKKKTEECPFCDFSSKYRSCIKEHIYRHYNINPFKCPYCEFTGKSRVKISQHVDTDHELESKTEPIRFVPLPNAPPKITTLKNKPKRVGEEESRKIVCLVCDKAMTDVEAESHSHDNVKAEFASKGDIVVKCCICLALRKDVGSLQEHHAASHSEAPLNYAFFKFLQNSRGIHCCGYCEKPFKYLKDMRTHHEALHGTLTLKYHTIPYTSSTPTMVLDSDDESESSKRSSIDSMPSATKRVARKSTSKLPPQAVAKKSTTKLPLHDESELGYSFYGTKPPPIEDYENVTTLIEFYNTMVPFTLKKLNEILKVNPVVLVQDIEKK